MSGYIGNALLGTTLLVPDDKRAMEDDWGAGDDCFFPDPLCNLYMRSDLFYGTPSFRTAWWPCNGGLMPGDLGLDVSMLQEVAWWGDCWGNLPGGCNGRLVFIGVTRDANGTPIGGATVTLIRTSTREVVSIVTSNANGRYVATTPYGDQHFLTMHYAGPPAIAGASIDSLLPG